MASTPYPDTMREDTKIVVKKAFRYRLNGMPHSKIAKRLNRSKSVIKGYFYLYKKQWQEEKEKQTRELEEYAGIKIDKLLEKSFNKADKLLENPKSKVSQKQVEMIWKAKKLLTDQKDSTVNAIPIKVVFEE